MTESAIKSSRGVIFIAGAKLYFIATSYAVQIFLPRILGSAESFGQFATVMNLAAMLSNVLIAATVQSVSKRISENETGKAQTLRQALALQVYVGLGLGGFIALAGPSIAARGLLDPKLARMIQIAGVVECSYALYAALVGALNGQRLFGKQARLDVTFSTLRTGGILGGAAIGASIGLGALGAMSGFAFAAVCVLGAAFFTVGIGTRSDSNDKGAWIRLMTPLWLYQLFLNGLMQIDLAVLKRALTQMSIDKGVAAMEAADIASRYAGFYRAAQTFAFVPYQVVIAFTFVIFPTISKATSSGDIEGAKAAVRNALRFSWLVLICLAAPMAGASEGVMRIAYPSDYLAASGALSVLVVAQVLFAMFVICATALSGSGRPALSAGIAALALGMVLVACKALIVRAGVTENALTATAWGTATGTFSALVMAGAAVYGVFRTFMPVSTLFRSAVAGASSFFIAHALPSHTKLSALIALVAGGVACIAVFFATGELKIAEILSLRHRATHKAAG